MKIEEAKSILDEWMKEIDGIRMRYSWDKSEYDNSIKLSKAIQTIIGGYDERHDVCNRVIEDVRISHSKIKESEFETFIPAPLLFYRAGLTRTKTQARRIIHQGGCYINECQITNHYMVGGGSIENGLIVLRAGKRRIHIFVVEQSNPATVYEEKMFLRGYGKGYEHGKKVGLMNPVTPNEELKKDVEILFKEVERLIGSEKRLYNKHDTMYTEILGLKNSILREKINEKNEKQEWVIKRSQPYDMYAYVYDKSLPIGYCRQIYDAKKFHTKNEAEIWASKMLPERCDPFEFVKIK